MTNNLQTITLMCEKTSNIKSTQKLTSKNLYVEQDYFLIHFQTDPPFR